MKTNEEVLREVSALNFQMDKLKKVTHVVKSEKQFFSEAYTWMQKRICNVVMLQDGKLGLVKKYCS